MTDKTQQTVKLSRSVSVPHYYSGHKYFNAPADVTQRHSLTEFGGYTHDDKYGSFSSNRKHFQNKLSKSSSNLGKHSYHSSSTTMSTVSEPTYYVQHSNLAESDEDEDADADDNDEDLSWYDSHSRDIEVHETASNCSFSSTTLTPSNSSAAVCQTPTTRSQVMRHIKRDNYESSHHPLLGMSLVTLSALLYAALNLSVKLLMDETPWQELMFIRMFITWLATMVWILISYKGKLNLCGPRRSRCLLTLRAIFLWGAMFTCWWSFMFLPVGDGTTLQQSFPVWVSLFAHFVWRNDTGDSHNGSQRLDLFGWVCVLAGLAGTVFVAQPSFIFGETAGNRSSHRDFGILIGMVSAVCSGAQYVIVNYTKKDCHWLQVEQMTAGLSTFVLCPLGAVAFALYHVEMNGGQFAIPWQSLSAQRWIEEIALGLLGFCALALLTRGSQLDAPARTAICLYLQIPFVYIGQSLIRRALPDVWVFIGIALVLSSVIIPAARKLREANQQKRLKQEQKKKQHRHRLHHTFVEGETTFEGERDTETKPLLSAEHEMYGGHRVRVDGVTVEWSSQDESIDDDGYYGLN
mmetsp:Transcript_25596/g.41794  ORF Transcript_25596/g.41794 Transcript_25596/m.41794 type:complete len:576 (+) Transcript_25596:35-1762(+)|eukprot:CAMPEP_0202700598 /NCGR_PEP_ID=MMETSP1385-20130828/13776_1 /ASSEMBLY_ACC=CAM_ASM_000861 /TAXON_ID=933848 /ORGANISM="Elphidium margaritaceum" /LENGTH=575 /DNA_ID=CAMNT_0049357819 /DNA_START=35 /DNA_END=1762 /DNA_ORIENTATION=-